MKIYTMFKIDIDSGQVLEEDSYEYDGPVAHCGGGKSTTNTQDPVYNARMAAIAERQQDMAEDYYAFWESDYKPFEQAQLQANTEMLPHLTKQSISEANVASEQASQLLQKDANGQNLIGLQAQNQRLKLEASNGLVGKQAEVARAAYDKALAGVDVGSEVQQARADVANSFAGAENSMRNDAARMGISTSSAGYTSAMAGLARDRAKGMAGAMTTARTAANDKNFSRLTSAAGMGLGQV
jgi:hypothetical protein